MICISVTYKIIICRPYLRPLKIKKLQNTLLSVFSELSLRFLADSNRRKRFCRPVPSHSAKVPWFWTAKIVLFCKLTKFHFGFFYSPLETTIKKKNTTQKINCVVFFAHSYRMILPFQFFIRRWRHVFRHIL